MHRLIKAQARRIAVGAQLLDAPRPTDLLTVVQQLTLLQIDPTSAIAPSADIVAWSRLGSAYRPAHLRQALEQDCTLFEFDALVRPVSDPGLYLAGAADWPSYEQSRAWLQDNDRFRRDILDLLGSSGPLSSRDIPDTCVVPWASTGWTNNRNVTQMLEFLMMRGEVAIAGRVGRQRLWNLAERVYPADVAVPSVEEAEEERAAARLARHRPAEGQGDTGRAGRRRRGRRAGRGRRHEGRVARRPRRARRGLRGAYGAAVAVRPARLRPAPLAGAVRLRLHPRDVQARGQAPLGLLRPADPPRRPAGRKVDATADRRASVLRCTRSTRT